MPMNDSNQEILTIATDRFERRLAEENGKVRVEMATEFGKLRADMAAESGALRVQMATEHGALRSTMEAGFGTLRAEMIDRNAAMLRWLLLFGVTQTAAIVGFLQFGK